MNLGEQQAINKECFDFVEQVWLPSHWDLGNETWFKPYKVVLVDECQDLNKAQLNLIKILAGSTGRILSVGDPKQAVMGFAGADDNSYNNVVKETGAIELPLSICYRCPKSHIELVKKQFPGIPIEAADNAIIGEIKQIKPEQIIDHVINGDMILGRKTAPLVGLCIRLISQGKKAIVKGKKIGETLKKELDEIAKLPIYYWNYFNDCLEQYRQIKLQQYQGLDNYEQLKEILQDKLQAIATIYQSNPQATGIEDLKSEISRLFSDDNAPITLSTCHRAKGLEAERIFIYKPEDIPMKWKNQQDWQYEQERNLLYVALTRSKSEIFIVGECQWYKRPKQCTQQSEVGNVNQDESITSDAEYEEDNEFLNWDELIMRIEGEEENNLFLNQLTTIMKDREDNDW